MGVAAVAAVMLVPQVGTDATRRGHLRLGAARESTGAGIGAAVKSRRFQNSEEARAAARAAAMAARETQRRTH